LSRRAACPEFLYEPEVRQRRTLLDVGVDPIHDQRIVAAELEHLPLCRRPGRPDGACRSPRRVKVTSRRSGGSAARRRSRLARRSAPTSLGGGRPGPRTGCRQHEGGERRLHRSGLDHDAVTVAPPAQPCGSPDQRVFDGVCRVITPGERLAQRVHSCGCGVRRQVVEEKTWPASTSAGCAEQQHGPDARPTSVVGVLQAQPRLERDQPRDLRRAGAAMISRHASGSGSAP